MEFKGDKGKWGFEIDEFFEFGRITSTQCSGNILEVQPTTDRTPYNLLLCSKAPEMLQMLKNVCTELYKLDNDLATEVKQLIKEVTEL